MRVLGRACVAGCMALALALVTACDASARLHAVATKLPRHYRLVESAANSNAPDEVCYADVSNPRIDAHDCDGSLTVFTLRPSDSGGNVCCSTGPPHPVTIHGHKAIWTWQSDQGERFARQVVWSPRAGLRVAVLAGWRLPLREFLKVARHIRVLKGRAWLLLLRQTSAAAQEGRFERGMRRVRVTSGISHGDRWKLYVLIPPGYPLSTNDLRPACTELVYRGVKGRGEFCNGNWQRVAGKLFAFGPVDRSWRRIRVADTRDRTLATGRAYRAHGWTRDRFFAVKLPTRTCAVFVFNALDRRSDSVLAAPPVYSRDDRRCRRRAGPR